VGKQLRSLCSLENVAFNITKGIVSQSLNKLGNVEETDIDRMTSQCPHSILQDEGVVPISGEEVCHCCNRIHRGPVEKVLLIQVNDKESDCSHSDTP
jgi:hypothetical protein